MDAGLAEATVEYPLFIGYGLDDPTAGHSSWVGVPARLCRTLGAALADADSESLFGMEYLIRLLPSFPLARAGAGCSLSTSERSSSCAAESQEHSLSAPTSLPA